MAKLDKMVHDAFDLIFMIIPYSFFRPQSFFVYFVHQVNDMKVMFLDVEVQGNEPFRVGLILTESLYMISGLSSSLEICASKRVIIPHTVPLNLLVWDSYPALFDIVLIV